VGENNGGGGESNGSKIPYILTPTTRHLLLHIPLHLPKNGTHGGFIDRSFSTYFL
jgi:hypothetical protein